MGLQVQFVGEAAFALHRPARRSGQQRERAEDQQHGTEHANSTMAHTRTSSAVRPSARMDAISRRASSGSSGFSISIWP